MNLARIIRAPWGLGYAARQGVLIKFQPVFEAPASGRDLTPMLPDRERFREALRRLRRHKRRASLVGSTDCIFPPHPGVELPCNLNWRSLVNLRRYL
jgi:hypothetical protein